MKTVAEVKRGRSCRRELGRHAMQRIVVFLVSSIATSVGGGY